MLSTLHSSIAREPLLCRRRARLLPHPRAWPLRAPLLAPGCSPPPGSRTCCTRTCPARRPVYALRKPPTLASASSCFPPGPASLRAAPARPRAVLPALGHRQSACCRARPTPPALRPNHRVTAATARLPLCFPTEPPAARARSRARALLRPPLGAHAGPRSAPPVPLPLCAPACSRPGHAASC
jgi:hypothetical protein